MDAVKCRALLVVLVVSVFGCSPQKDTANCFSQTVEQVDIVVLDNPDLNSLQRGESITYVLENQSDKHIFIPSDGFVELLFQPEGESVWLSVPDLVIRDFNRDRIITPYGSTDAISGGIVLPEIPVEYGQGVLLICLHGFIYVDGIATDQEILMTGQTPIY